MIIALFAENQRNMEYCLDPSTVISSNCVGGYFKSFFITKTDTTAVAPISWILVALTHPLQHERWQINCFRSAGTQISSVDTAYSKCQTTVLMHDWNLRELLDTVKARKLAYHGHTMRKQGSCLEKEIMQGTTPGARRWGRQRTAWMDNIKTWTGLSVEESIRMTEDRDKWRQYVHGVANPRIEDG